MSATATATAPAVASDWLKVDDTAAQRGYAPAEYGDPATDPAPPVVPTIPSPLGPGQPVAAPVSTGVQYDSDGSGAWPALPLSGDGRTWLDRGDGFPQGLWETALPATNGPGMWASTEPLQTWDYHSQQVDSAGWNQNVPNDRLSARWTWGQANPLNNPTWYGYSENPAAVRLAVRPVAYTTDNPAFGTPGFSAGELPVWTQLGGQGSTAYETPSPPPTTSAAAVSVSDPAGGWA